MQRANFDVGSIAALLRQTEANLSAISRPRREEPGLAPFPFSQETRQAWTSTPLLAEPTPIGALPVARGPIGPLGGLNGLELEAQVIHLRSCVEGLDRRLENELQAFLGVCEKRLQAKEEQLRGVGDTLQVAADNAVESLTRRVDARLRDLERSANERGDRSLDEVWETLRRLQADGRGLESRLQRCALADDLAERVREVDRSLQQRLDEKVQAHERRATEYRTQLESGTESWREAMSQRCAAIEQKVWDQQTDRSDLADAILKKIPEMAPLRELHEELKAQVYAVEVQQRRLTTCEAKLSKLSALDAKLEFVETHTAQQVAEQAQETRGFGDVAQRLSQKMSAIETTFQRLESQGTTVEARLHARIEEDRSQAAVGLEALQQRLLQRVDDVEAHLQRSSTRVEREVAQQVAALAMRTSEDGASLQRQLEGRFRELEARGDSRATAAVQQLERVAEELRATAQAQAEALQQHLEDVLVEQRDAAQARLQRSERSLVEVRAAAEEAGRDAARLAHEASAAATQEVERRFEGLTAQLHASLEGFREQVEARHTGLEGGLGILEEQQRARAAAQEADAGTLKSRLEALESRLTEAHVGAVRAQTGVDSLRGSVAGLEGLRASLGALESNVSVVEEQVRARMQEWAAENEASKGRADVAQARVTDLAGTVQHLQSSVETLRVGAAGLEARGEHTRVAVASVEAQVLAIQRRIDALRNIGAEAAPGTGGAAAAQLPEPGEVRVLERSVGDLRFELGELRARLVTGGLAAGGPAVSGADARILGLQDAVGELRSELVVVRSEVQGTATRTSQHAVQLAAAQSALEGVQESVASLQRLQRAQPPLPLLIASGASSLDRSSHESHRGFEPRGGAAQLGATGAGVPALGDLSALDANSAAPSQFLPPFGVAQPGAPSVGSEGGPLAGSPVFGPASSEASSLPRPSEASLDSARRGAAEAGGPEAEHRPAEASAGVVEQGPTRFSGRQSPSLGSSQELRRSGELFREPSVVAEDRPPSVAGAEPLSGGSPRDVAQAADAERSRAGMSLSSINDGARSMERSLLREDRPPSVGGAEPPGGRSPSEASQAADVERSTAAMAMESIDEGAQSMEQSSGGVLPIESLRDASQESALAADALGGSRPAGSGGEPSGAGLQADSPDVFAAAPPAVGEVASPQAAALERSLQSEVGQAASPEAAAAAGRSLQDETLETLGLQSLGSFAAEPEQPQRSAHEQLQPRTEAGQSQEAAPHQAPEVPEQSAQAPEAAAAAPGQPEGQRQETRPARQRGAGLPLVARATKKSKEADMRKAFDDMVVGGSSSLSLEDLRSYLADYLGFGAAEVHEFFQRYGPGDPGGSMPFESFCKGYAALNPYMLMDRKNEMIMRKPGSLGGQQLNLDGLEDCEVYACDVTAQVFVDYCKRSLVLLGPCESSIFVRDCEDCVFWIACQQLRTNNCHRCTFYLYSKTEPIVETSEDLAFAPWSARFPGCTEQFQRKKFNPGANLWNAIFDFTGKLDRSNWRILPLEEVVELVVDLQEPPALAVPADSPFPPVTHEALCAEPLASGESCGEGIANIPQCRPDPPPPPGPGFQGIRTHAVRDAWQQRPVGAQTLRPASEQPEASGLAPAAASDADVVAASFSELSSPGAPRTAASAVASPEAPGHGAPDPSGGAASDLGLPEMSRIAASDADVTAAGASELEIPVLARAGASALSASGLGMQAAAGARAAGASPDVAMESVSALDIPEVPTINASDLGAAAAGASELDQPAEARRDAPGPDLGLSAAGSDADSWDDSDGDDEPGLRRFPGLDEEEEEGDRGGAAPTGEDGAGEAPAAEGVAEGAAAAASVPDASAAGVEEAAARDAPQAGSPVAAAAHLSQSGGDRSPAAERPAEAADGSPVSGTASPVGGAASPAGARPAETAAPPPAAEAQSPAGGSEDIESSVDADDLLAGLDDAGPGLAPSGMAAEPAPAPAVAPAAAAAEGPAASDARSPAGGSEGIESSVDADELLAGLDDVGSGPPPSGRAAEPAPAPAAPSAAEGPAAADVPLNVPPPAATVQGDMTGGDDDEDSDDGLPLPAGGQASQAPPPPPAGDSDDDGGEDVASPSAAAPASRAAVRAMLGEDSSEEGGEEEAAAPPSAGRSATSLSATGGDRPWQRPQLSTRVAMAARDGSDEDDDEDEIERAAGAVRHNLSTGSGSGGAGRSLLGSRSGLLGASGLSVGSPAGGGRAGASLGERAEEHGSRPASTRAGSLGGVAASALSSLAADAGMERASPGAATSTPLGGLAAGALSSLAADAGMARAGARAAAADGGEDDDDDGNSWDGSSMGSVSPRAMAALGIDSPGGSDQRDRSGLAAEEAPATPAAPAAAQTAAPGSGGGGGSGSGDGSGIAESDEFGDDDDIPLA